MMLPDREPDQQVDPTDWTTYTGATPGTIGQFTVELAHAATTRQAELGRQAAENLPEWAVQHLGQPPEHPEQRAEWERRAGIAAAYRELRSIPQQHTSLGPAPSREQEFHHTLWRHAHAALGYPEQDLDIKRASNDELREMRRAWHREQTWAPYYVAEELQQAYTLAEQYRQDAVLHRAELDTLDAGSPAVEQAREQIDRAERLATAYQERAHQLEEIHAERAAWREATDPTRARAELAGAELEQRNASLWPESRPEPEQLGLFEVTTDHQEPTQEHTTAEPGPETAVDVKEPVTETGVDDDPVDRVRWWQRWAAKLGLVRDENPTSEVQPETPEPELVVATEPTSEESQAELGRQGAEVDEDQLALFDVEPELSDVIAAEPVHSQERDQVDDLHATLAEARRQARAVEQQRLARHAAEQERAARHARETAAEIAETERKRRDDAERAVDGAPAPQREQEQQTVEAEPELELSPQQPHPVDLARQGFPNSIQQDLAKRRKSPNQDRECRRTSVTTAPTDPNADRRPPGRARRRLRRAELCFPRRHPTGVLPGMDRGKGPNVGAAPPVRAPAA
jgi:hypothetical protein